MEIKKVQLGAWRLGVSLEMEKRKHGCCYDCGVDWAGDIGGGDDCGYYDGGGHGDYNASGCG